MPCPDSSPRLFSYRNNKHDPGTRHLGYRAWTLKLNQSPSEEARAAQYWLLYCVSLYGKYGLATVDNSKWASVFGHVGVWETTCSTLNAVCRHADKSAWTGFDTYGTDLQPAVFGDINSLSVREVDLHFVTGREREVFNRGRAESWKDA